MREREPGRLLSNYAHSIADPRERANAWQVAADAFLEEGKPRSAADALIRATEARAIHSGRWGEYYPILTLKQAAAIASLDDRIERGENASALAMLSQLTQRPRGVPATTDLYDFLDLLRRAIERLRARS